MSASTSDIASSHLAQALRKMMEEGTVSVPAMPVDQRECLADLVFASSMGTEAQRFFIAAVLLDPKKWPAGPEPVRASVRRQIAIWTRVVDRFVEGYVEGAIKSAQRRFGVGRRVVQKARRELAEDVEESEAIDRLLDTLPCIPVRRKVQHR
jgi:hypothetical protein